MMAILGSAAAMKAIAGIAMLVALLIAAIALGKMFKDKGRDDERLAQAKRKERDRHEALQVEGDVARLDDAAALHQLHFDFDRKH